MRRSGVRDGIAFFVVLDALDEIVRATKEILESP
jgi:hypothetical protein